MRGAVVHDDQYGSVIDWADRDLIELRWYDGSASLTSDAFNAWLAVFADHCEALRRGLVLVDAVQFEMPLGDMDEPWRQANIVPRYNDSGVRRFAFHVREGMAPIGAPPAPEGPADFPTAYFATRAASLAWLLT